MLPVLDRLFESVQLPCEVLVVVDSPDDTTIPVIEKYARSRAAAQAAWSTPTAGARPTPSGSASTPRPAPAVVVTMADGCDDPRQIDELARLVERGVAVAAASRYMAGGQQVGGPLLKGLMSQAAGRSLRLVRPRRHPGRDQLVQGLLHRVRPRGRHRLPRRLRDRHRAGRQGPPAAPPGRRDPDHLAGPQPGRVQLQAARSGCRSYLRWYRFAFGPPLTAEQIRDRTER